LGEELTKRVYRWRNTNQEGGGGLVTRRKRKERSKSTRELTFKGTEGGEFFQEGARNCSILAKEGGGGEFLLEISGGGEEESRRWPRSVRYGEGLKVFLRGLSLGKNGWGGGKVLSVLRVNALRQLNYLGRKGNSTTRKEERLRQVHPRRLDQISRWLKNWGGK